MPSACFYSSGSIANSKILPGTQVSPTPTHSADVPFNMADLLRPSKGVCVHVCVRMCLSESLCFESNFALSIMSVALRVLDSRSYNSVP